MLKTEKLFRNPIYMAFDVHPRCLPVIQHSFVNYMNVFLSNERSKTQSIYPLAKSNMNNEVMEYLMSYLTHFAFYKTEYTPQKFAKAIDENPDVLKLLKFYLEYVRANIQLGYNFFYLIFNPLYECNFSQVLPTKLNPKKGCFASIQAMDILDSNEKKFKYFSGNGKKSIYYGLHSFLVSD